MGVLERKLELKKWLVSGRMSHVEPHALVTLIYPNFAFILNLSKTTRKLNKRNNKYNLTLQC